MPVTSATSPTASFKRDARQRRAQQRVGLAGARLCRGLAAGRSPGRSRRVARRRGRLAPGRPDRRAGSLRAAWSVRGRSRHRAVAETAARSVSVAARRGPVSNSTSVAGMRASSAMRARRAPSFGGRKPAKKNWSVGRPATAKRGQRCRGAGQSRHGMAGFMGGAHQLEARIGDQGRAGIRHQCDRRRRRRACAAIPAAPAPHCDRDRV